MTEICNYVPRDFVAGDTVKFKLSNSLYPASDGWACSTAFVKDGKLFTESTSVADGDDFLITLVAADTLDLLAGSYKWRVSYSKAGERYSPDQGTLVVGVNYSAQSSGYDSRTDAEAMLEALNATMRGKATNDQLSMMIGGRQLQRLEPAALVKWRDMLKAEVGREQTAEKAALGLRTGKKTRVRL